MVGWCGQVELHGAVLCAIRERVTCRCWWWSPKSRGHLGLKIGWHGLFFSSTATTLHTKGVWPLSVNGTVWLSLPLRTMVTTVLLRLVFSLHTISDCQRRTSYLKWEKSAATVKLEEKNPLPKITDWSLSDSLTFTSLPLERAPRCSHCFLKQTRQESQPEASRIFSKCI